MDSLQPKLEIHQRKEQEMPAVELEIQIDPEAELVRAWRIEELVRAGYTPEHAQELADLNHVDLDRPILLRCRLLGPRVTSS